MANISWNVYIDGKFFMVTHNVSYEVYEKVVSPVEVFSTVPIDDSIPGQLSIKMSGAMINRLPGVINTIKLMAWDGNGQYEFYLCKLGFSDPEVIRDYKQFVTAYIDFQDHKIG